MAYLANPVIALNYPSLPLMQEQKLGNVRIFQLVKR